MPKTKQSEESSCEIVGTKLAVRHAFGYGWQPYDEIISYQSSSRDKDMSDRVIYRVGKQICIVDPDGNTPQRFLNNRPKLVAKVLHLAVSKNNRYLSVCESVVDKTHAQLSVYSLTTLSRSKTLIKQSPGADFTQSAFFAESKYLAVLHEGDENQVIVYHWEKEKHYKSVVLPSKATKLSTSPTHFMFTVSGMNLLRHAYLPPDGILKLNHLFSASVKENDNFITHCWMPFQELNAHRLIAIGGATDDAHSTDGSRRQLVHVFEGTDAAYGVQGPPISIELKNSISLRLEAGGAVMSCAVHSKGFVLFGLNGLVSFFERTDDKRDPFVETRRLILGGSGPTAPTSHPGVTSGPSIESASGNISRSDLSVGHSEGKQSRTISGKDDFEVITSATVLPSEENLVMLTRSSRVLTLPLTGLDVFSGSSMPSLNGSGDEREADVARSGGLVGAYSVATSPLTDLYFGGNHQQRVMGLDVAFQRPIAVTVSHDHTLRIWNYESMRCELSYEFNETPYAVAVMASGFQVIVSFKDKIRMYNVLQDKLRLFRETTLKGCRELKLSHNNSLFAAAAALSVYVYDIRNFQQLLYLQGHIGQVRKLSWAPGDQTLFSSGADGNVYGWSMTSDIRIDVSTSSNNLSSPILCLAVDGQTPGIIGGAIDKRNGRMAEDYLDGGVLCKAIVGPNSAVVGFSNGVMKVCEYSGLVDTRNVSARSDTLLRSSSVQYQILNAVTAVCISIDKKTVYTGHADGSLRAYAWPFMTGDPPFVEVSAHGAAVVDIREAPTATSIITVAEDGTVFYVSTLKGDMMSFGGIEVTSLYTGGIDVPMNSDLIMTTREDIEEHVAEVQDLQKKLHEAMAKTEFAKHNLELAHAEEVRKLVESHHVSINLEKDRYESLQASMDSKITVLRDTIKSNEQDHIKTAAEIENRYEHKLADQFERYDRLSEEMEAINQKCQGLLAAERAESERLMSDLRVDNRHREKKLKADFKRVRDERATDENAFKEILDQQEEEYENELKQLIAAAEEELKKERETITKYQTFAQTQTTKLDQYNKRYREVQEEYKKGLEELKQEKKEKLELLEAVEHYKKNLSERDVKLADKDKLILELRSNIRTLENFRVVLDHRQQQLNAEKGPITEHIVGLENHIRTMYEELVEEFEAKKVGAKEAEKKDLKLSASINEVSRLRAENRQKEVYISAFKRDLENIMGAFGQKELEEAVHKLYRKYLKGDGKEGQEETNKKSTVHTKTSALASRLINNDADSDDDEFNIVGAGGRSGSTSQHRNSIKGGKKKRKKELLAELNQEFLDNAKEANRQRAFVERSAADLKHRLELASLEQIRSSQRRLHENSHLVFECNELRTELRNSARKLKVALEEKDRLMVALANAISANGGASTQVTRSLLKSMAITPTTASEENRSQTGSVAKDSQSIHSKMSTHSTQSIDSRKLPPPKETAVDGLVNKVENVIVVNAEQQMDDEEDNDNRSLTSTGAEQITQAEKWWDGAGSKPTSPMNSRRPSATNSKPGSAGQQLTNSYSTNAMPQTNSGAQNVVLSKSQPLLAHARIPHGGRLSSKVGGLSSLMLPTLPSEDLGSMSDAHGPQGRQIPGLGATSPSRQVGGPSALKSKLITKHSQPLQNLNTKANAAHNNELRIKRATSEIEHLSRRLDDSEKEKLLQQAEINRLRNTMQKMQISLAVSNSPPKKNRLNQSLSAQQPSAASSVFIGSHRDDGMYPPEMQTAADTAGVPSFEDLEVLRVSSAKGSSRGLSGPAKSQQNSRPASAAMIPPTVMPALSVPKRQAMDDDAASMNSSLSAGSARR